MAPFAGRSTIFVALAAAILLLFGLLFLLRAPTADPARRSGASSAVPTEDPVLAVAVHESQRESAPESSSIAVASPEARKASPGGAIAPRAEEPAKDAQGKLHVTVLDAANDQPVALAKVQLIGLRRADDPGSWYDWPGEPPTAETDSRGQAELPYPAWVEKAGLTSAVDLTVSHSDYTEHRDSSCTIEGLAQEAVVRMNRGAFLVVSGWIGTREKIVRDVTPTVDDESHLGPDSWLPIRDGRLSTSRLAPGPHVLSLSWKSSEGVSHYSRVEAFELRADEQLELALELLPGSVLEGSLDETVPRPVEDGEAVISVDFGAPSGPTSMRTWKTSVEPDGSFRFRDLPPGKGQIIALCRGWVSKRIRAVDPADVGMWVADSADVPAAIEEMGDRALIPARIEIPSIEPIVVAMEATATVEVEVKDASGLPIEGAVLMASPNVRWRNGYSQIFLDRIWKAGTGSNGIARLEDLPPDPRTWLNVSAEGFRRKDRVEVDLSSGQTARLTVVMARKDG